MSRTREEEHFLNFLKNFFAYNYKAKYQKTLIIHNSVFKKMEGNRNPCTKILNCFQLNKFMESLEL